MLPRQIEELVLVLPAERFLLELFGFGRRQRRLGDFGNEVCSRGFSKTVDKDADKWDLDKDVKTQAKPKKDPGSVSEPKFLLFRGITDTAKVRLELTACQWS